MIIPSCWKCYYFQSGRMTAYLMLCYALKNLVQPMLGQVFFKILNKSLPEYALFYPYNYV